MDGCSLPDRAPLLELTGTERNNAALGGQRPQRRRAGDEEEGTGRWSERDVRAKKKETGEDGEW